MVGVVWKRTFELGEQGAGVHPLLVLAVEGEQAIRLGVDLARIDEGQLVASGGELPWEGDGCSLVGGVYCNPTGERGTAFRGAERGRNELEIGGVESERRSRLDDLKVDDDAAGEGESAGVGRDENRIMVRDRSSRELGRKAGIDGVGLTRRLGL
jgi:hypothetical protein